MDKQTQAIKTISYSDFKMWDVKRYSFVFHASFENAVCLREILTPFKQAISKEELLVKNWKIIKKINFHGELFLREYSDIASYKGKLNKVPDNSIIYSKINVRHGCVYYHEKSKEPFGVSSEYPTFVFDETKVDGYYLQRVLRSDEFKRLLNVKTSGISKARVKVDEFLDIQIPLPLLDKQQQIVEAFNAKINLAQEQEQKAKELGLEAHRYFFEVLGVEKNSLTSKRKGLSLICYSQLTKWALSHSLKQNVFNMQGSPFPKVPLKELLVFFKGGKTPSKQRKDFWGKGVNWTSPKDFNGLYIHDSKDQITEVAISETSIEVFPAGVFLSVFRSGILQHSFPTAITTISTTINQDLKAYSLKEELIIKEYYLYFAEIFKEYILLNASKKSVTVESVNTDEFFGLAIPLPPLNKQKEIVVHILKLKQQIESLGKQAKDNREKAVQELEKEIFSS